MLEHLDVSSLVAMSMMAHSCLVGLGVEKAARKDRPEPFELKIFKPLVAAFGSRVSSVLGPVVEDLVDAGVEVTPLGPRFRPAALAAFHARLRENLGDDVADAVADDVFGAITSMYTVANQVAARQVRRKPRLIDIDEDSIRVLSQTTAWYTANGYRRVFEPRVNDIAQKVLNEGFGSAELSDRLFTALDGELAKGPSYWAVVAGQAVNTARNFAQVNVYRAAGVDKYEIVAVLDERTSQMCEYLDGAVFRVQPASDHVQSVVDAGAPRTDAAADNVMRMHPWVGVDRSRFGTTMPGLFVAIGEGLKMFLPGSRLDSGGQLAGAGARPPDWVKLEELDLFLPPYHAHCRTTTVATRESVELGAYSTEHESHLLEAIA